MIHAPPGAGTQSTDRNMAELNADIQDRIAQLSEEGNIRADAGDYDRALGLFGQAWELLPEPKHDWEDATTVLGAIGDVSLLKGDYAAARDALQASLECPDGLGNPFLHLRLGQALFELGEQDRAAEELMRAYMGGGDDIYEGDDPKYLAFLRTCADLDQAG